FERLVERPSARLFRTRLRPTHVLRRVERAMEADRRISQGRDLVPDRFRVRLNPADLEALGPLDAVAAELASGALRFARAHGFTVRERPRVALHADPAIESGEVAVAVAFSPPVRPGPQAAGDDAGTRIFDVPVVRAPRIRLAVREPGRPPRDVALGAEPMSVGRAPDCDLVLADARVSRHHARLGPRDGVIVLSDLGSTNGTYVNDQRVTEVVLGEGDRIQLGNTQLAVERAPDDAPVAG
ncbi:MAG: DUF2662 domain-containing protein, partial [Chloroflexi bacterium]|nr:DUF2662 domain-containing protein [Chloroflexota bacterium]